MFFKSLPLFIAALLAWILIGTGSPEYDQFESPLLEKALFGLALVMFLTYALHSSYREKGMAVERQIYFFDNPTPMWLFDVGTSKFKNVNNMALKAYGYTHSEMVGMSVTDVQSPNIINRLDYRAADFVKEGKADLGIWQHQDKNGKAFYVRLFSSRKLYRSKTCRLVVAINIDIQVHTEEILAELNQQTQTQLKYLESLLEQQPSYLVLRFNLSGEYTYVNPALCKRLELELDDIVGTSVFEHIVEEDAIAAGKAMQLCLSNVGTAFPIRIHRLMPDGKLAVADYEMVAIADIKGEVTEIQCMGVETTEKLKYLEEVINYKTRLETLLSSITDGFYAVDTNFCFTYVNEKMASVLNASPKDLIGESIWPHFPASSVDLFKENFTHAMAVQSKVHFEQYLEEHTLLISITAYPSKDGLSIYWRDITEQKSIEEQVTKQSSALKRIAWIQSHVVRAPLANILGLIGIFNHKNPADPFNAEILTHLKTSGEELDKVIHDVVRISIKNDSEGEETSDGDKGADRINEA